MKKQFVAFFFVAVILSLSSISGATPLVLDYSVTDTGNLGLSKYQYNFQLILDNHDNTWSAGQQWDWIIFGDRAYDSTQPYFENNHFILLTSDPIINVPINSTFGGHNGATLAIGANSVLIPGWAPTQIGQALTWSGTSDVELGQGSLLWSSLVTSGTPTVVFEVGQMTNPVPEPGTIALLGLGMAGLAVYGKRRQNKA